MAAVIPKRRYAFINLHGVIPECRRRSVRALAHTCFLPEWDPAPVVEFFTRTGITAAGSGFHTD